MSKARTIFLPFLSTNGIDHAYLLSTLMMLRRYLIPSLYFEKDCMSTRSEVHVSSTPRTLTRLVGNRRFTVYGVLLLVERYFLPPPIVLVRRNSFPATLPNIFLSSGPIFGILVTCMYVSVYDVGVLHSHHNRIDTPTGS